MTDDSTTDDSTTAADDRVDAIRAQVQATVDQLSDEALVRLWRVLQDWLQATAGPRP